MHNEKLKEVYRRETEKGADRNQATLEVARKLVSYVLAADRAFFSRQREPEPGTDIACDRQPVAS
jgi:hypothetical protein